MIIGLDNGNSMTKTALTSSVSGYTKHSRLPYGANKYLMYYGDYYTPAEQSFPYVQDKTTDDKMLCLSLYSIADEIVARLKANGVNTEDELAKKIESINEIVLGVGLPPAHFSLEHKTVEYFKSRMADGIRYSFCGFDFSYRLSEIFVLPQDYVAIVTDKSNSITGNYNSFIGIDIGGLTVDVVQVEDKKPVGTYQSLPLGVLCFYQKVINVVMNETTLTLSNKDIEAVLQGKKTVIPQECITIIHEQAQLWVERIIYGLGEAGYELRITPCLFLGGGALLFRPYIQQNKLITIYDIISNPCANAIGYEKFIKMQLKARSQK